MKCDGSVEDCIPQFIWIGNFFNNATNKAALGVPEGVNFVALSNDVSEAFNAAGDLYAVEFRSATFSRAP